MAKPRRKAKKNARRARRNKEAGADFPFEQVVEVEAVRFHADGTVDLFLEDSEIPAAVAASENRRRNRKRAVKAKKNRKKRR